MLRRLASLLLSHRAQRHVVFGSRSVGGACHGDRPVTTTVESLLRDDFALDLRNSLAEQRYSSSRAFSTLRKESARATGCRAFSASSEPQLYDDANSINGHMSSTLRKALASHFPPTDDNQVQAVLVASMTKLLCEPPAPALASIRHVSASSKLPQDTKGDSSNSSSTQHSSGAEDATDSGLSSESPAQSPAEKELARKQAAYRYGTAQRERYQASVAKFRSKRPQQDFTRYHEKLKAEARVARERPLEEQPAGPPHSPEAMQDLAKAVASLLWKDEQEVLALLQRSAYGRQQAPVPLPDTDQARATLQEMLRIFAVITKFDPVNTVWTKVLVQNPTLLSCTVDQMRNTLSFLEMLDMAPAQIAVCLSKAPVLLTQNLEDKLLPLCDYLNRIGLDLRRQRTLVTWRPEVLSQRLDWVKGQCALLAGYGIQGHTLANVLYKSSMLIMTPRVNLALRLKYLFSELGCTPEDGCLEPCWAIGAGNELTPTYEDIRRGAGIVGVEAPIVAFRVAWLRHVGRQVQLPSQIPGGEAGWKEHVESIRDKTSFGPEEPVPIWIAVKSTLRWLCAMLDCNLREAQKFEREWRQSEEAQKWSGIAWKGKKRRLAQKSGDSQTKAAQNAHA